MMLQVASSCLDRCEFFNTCHLEQVQMGIPT